MEALGALLAIPIMLLNLLGGIVGGIGLVFQGDWTKFLIGVAYTFVGGFMVSILMLPSLIFLPLVVWASKRGNVIVALLAAIPNLLWTYLVIAASCVTVFGAMVKGGDGDVFHLLWGYSTAIGPWSFLANKDRQSGETASTTSLFFIQIGTIAMMYHAYKWPDQTDLPDLMRWFLPFMGLGIATQLIGSMVAISQSRNRGY